MQQAVFKSSLMKTARFQERNNVLFNTKQTDHKWILEEYFCYNNCKLMTSHFF